MVEKDFSQKIINSYHILLYGQALVLEMVYYIKSLP